jgi:hypothetical protein
MNDLAPIVLFIYNRPDHTQKTLDALSQNNLASESHLYIFSDAAKNETERENVNEVRKKIKHVFGFKNITVCEQKTNQGLAKSIINGVTKIVNKYGKVIVLEDDLITSPHFLKYMNDALNLYSSYAGVASISGCNYPIDTSTLDKSTYFLRLPLCWGWATWKDSWQEFNKDIDVIDELTKDQEKYINFDHTHNYLMQAVRNRSGKINTWFIYWYISLALKNRLTLFPQHSLVSNIGFDGTGDNCGISSNLSSQLYEKEVNIQKQPIIENLTALSLHKQFFKSIQLPMWNRFLSWVKWNILR